MSDRQPATIHYLPRAIAVPPGLVERVERVLADHDHGPGSRRLVEIAILTRGLEALERALSGEPDAPRRIPVPFHLRIKIMKRDGFMCGICGKAVKRVSEVHIDHILPVAKGGTNAEENLRVTHARCNLAKGAK